MTAFVFASAVLVLLVLGYVLRPLLQQRLAMGLGMLAMLAALTALTYTMVGTPNALDPAQRTSPKTISEAIERLQAELERDPNQVEGWRLLGRAYAAEGRLDDARDAAARAVKLAPSDPDLLTEAAEARAMAAEGRRFDDEAISMLREALAIQPMHQRARWFLGIAQRQAMQPADAAKTWEPLLAMVGPDAAPGLRTQIDAARSDAGLPPLPAAAASVPPGSSIKVSISLDPALAMRLPRDAVLFVIARAPGGAPIPVAVEKLPAVQFPIVVTLDDDDSLMPTTKLSQLERVEITARISASGDASAQRGDFEAASTQVDNAPDAAAALMIDRVVE